ncbi:MAG: 30S ribosomal protein S3ae [Asgard group archaeon]|nr:30S ribosomal protein S3ae [Asgard group archaeon]
MSRPTTAAARKKKKDKDTRRVVDKFTLKSWYKIISPPSFGANEIAETPASSSDYVLGRTLNTTLMELIGDYKKMHVKITFKVHDVKGDNALTEFHGHEYTRDYLRSMIRRRRTRIDGIFNVITKDGAKLRVSTIALTPFRCKTSHQKGIRQVMFDVVNKRANRMSFDNVVKDIVTGKMATEIYKKARKVHPIQNVDVWKSVVVNLPTMKLEEEILDKKEASITDEDSDESDEEVEVIEEST